MTPQSPDRRALRSRLADAKHIGILTHVNPDGDAVGALLGLAWALRSTGKPVSYACVDPLPEAFAFLPGFDEVVDSLPDAVDLTISVDAASFDRTGMPGERVDVNIDHHISNTLFGAINIVEPEAASTTEVLARLLPDLGMGLDSAIATCLLTGLVSDTIGFSTDSTTGETLSTARLLMEAGANLSSIYFETLNKRSFAAVKLWGEAFVNLERDNGLIWARLPLSAKQRVGYWGQGDADVTNILRTVRDIDVAIVLVERDGGVVKVSWRSRAGLDVSAIAADFGGGGHSAAAGATLADITLDEAEVLVLERTRRALQVYRDHNPTS